MSWNLVFKPTQSNERQAIGLQNNKHALGLWHPTFAFPDSGFAIAHGLE